MFGSARRSLLLTLPALILSVASAGAQQPPPQSAAPAPSAADVLARGRYLVEDVATCWRCHSPVDARGVRDRAHWLQGGQVGMRPTVAEPGDWAMIAPRLAGTPPGTDAEFIRLLTTGISRRGHTLRQPMPPFRFSQADAEAILAYLKSLGGRPSALLTSAQPLTQNTQR